MFYPGERARRKARMAKYPIPDGTGRNSNDVERKQERGRTTNYYAGNIWIGSITDYWKGCNGGNGYYQTHDGEKFAHWGGTDGAETYLIDRYWLYGEPPFSFRNAWLELRGKQSIIKNPKQYMIQTKNVTEMRHFFDGKLYKNGDDGINPDTVKEYEIINKAFNPDYRVELSVMHGATYAVVRAIEGSIKGHIYLSMDYSTVTIFGDETGFSGVSKKLKNGGYVVKYGHSDCYDFSE